MKNRILRVCMCLLLIVCLIVNISPIRAKAVASEVALIGVSATLVVGSLLIGLGVSAGADTSDFDNAVTNAISGLSDFVSDGLINVAKYTRTDGSLFFAVPLAVVETVRNYLFDSGIISVNNNLPSDLNDTWSSRCNTYANNYNYAFFASSYNENQSKLYYYIGYSNDSSFTYTYQANSNNYYVTTVDGAKFDLVSGPASSSTLYSSPNILGIYLWAVDFTFSLIGSLDADFSTDLDLQLGSIASPLDDFVVGYTDWYANAVTIPGSLTGSDDDVVGVPLGLGQTYEGTRDKTQEEVWAGTSDYTIADTETDADTDTDSGTTTGTGAITQSWLGGILQTIISTLSDILQGVLSIPDAIAGFFADVIAAVQAIPSAITEFFTIDTSVESYAISWTDFFPFCIPFDIRDFVLVLDAEPEAPHFEFDVDFPYMDEPWHIDIDFSCWDNVALVLRRLELLLFIVGLAMATRNFYIRG